MEQYKVNDCHVHIGKSSDINQSLDDIDDLVWGHATLNEISNVLIFSADTDITKNNKLVYELTNQLKFAYGLYWITPDIENLEITDKMIGAKYHGTYLNQPIKPYPYLAELEKKQAVLMVHCGRYKEGRLESNTSYQHALEVAKIYPKLKVIMAHMGGTDTNVCKVAINDSQNYDNVYFDTSGITTPYIIEYAVSKIPSKRILFGSDAPWCSFRAMYYTVLDAQIPQEDKENIFYNSFNDLIKKCVSVQTR